MQAMLDSRQQSHREKVSALRYNKNPFKSTIKEAVPEQQELDDSNSESDDPHGKT